ncbi:MAG: peptide deformylase [Clostridia bacterium]|nr:peptide deformylase [Clostridia bacterium]
MAIRNIIKYPEDEETLRKVSKPVTVFDDRLVSLLEDLKDTMHHAKGAGLSAVQVGVLKRVCVVNTGKRHLEFINPVIVKQCGKNKIKEEGCLSIPNVWEEVIRPNKVDVKFQDRFGNCCQETFIGYEAKAICHECDHLDGILFIDRVKNKK